ncbi:MAG: hypothetical protein IPK22_15100 [Verrucomicrobiaceae bacterium]|nr:hypothetical protein [Verrucomicrobiaceae bacterium]
MENPTLAFSSVIRHFGPPLREGMRGVDASASVSSKAVFDAQKVCIGPCAVIEDDVRIGDGTVIHAGAFVGHGAQIGVDCVLHPNVTIHERCLLGNRVIVHSGCVIGADGFGYELVKIRRDQKSHGAGSLHRISCQAASGRAPHARSACQDPRSHRTCP